MASDRDAAGYLGWFLLGSMVGAGVALLLAPRTGRELRELLGEQGRTVLGQVDGLTAGLPEQTADWVSRSRQLLTEQADRLLRAFEAGREAMRDEVRRRSPGGEPGLT